jgi:hypothetical protein
MIYKYDTHGCYLVVLGHTRWINIWCGLISQKMAFTGCVARIQGSIPQSNLFRLCVAVGIVLLIGGGWQPWQVFMRKGWPWAIESNVFWEFHAPWTLKTSFVDFGKGYANCSRYERLHFSSLLPGFIWCRGHKFGLVSPCDPSLSNSPFFLSVESKVVDPNDPYLILIVFI